MAEDFTSEIAHPSRSSVHLSLLDRDDSELSQASGFFYRRHDQYWLVTNLHVASGMHPVSGDLLGRTRPSKVRVTAPTGAPHAPCLFTASLVDEDLNPAFVYSTGLFHEPSGYPLRSYVPGITETFPDVALIPVPREVRYAVKDIAYRDDPDPIPLHIADTVYIVGYPGTAGLLPGQYPVWTRGSVASEPSSAWPWLLIDARTRGGQSGSPVIAYRPRTEARADGGFRESYPESTRLVGVYSGRTDSESDLGRVWPASTIRESLFS